MSEIWGRPDAIDVRKVMRTVVEPGLPHRWTDADFGGLGTIVRDLGTGDPWPEDPAERALTDRRMDRQLARMMPHPRPAFRHPVRDPSRRDRGLGIPRPDLPRIEAWFVRTAEGPPFRTHVMPPLS